MINWEDKPLKARYLTSYPSLGKFYPWDPKPEQVHLEDVAWSLSLICRYNGLLPYSYPVGQHSIIVSKMVAPEFAFEGLMHDAAEYVLNDLPRPVKVGLEDYKALEKTVEPVIAVKFGLRYPRPPEIKVADRYLMRYEILFFYGPDRFREDFGEEPPSSYGGFDLAFRERRASEVRDEFLSLFHTYQGRR